VWFIRGSAPLPASHHCRQMMIGSPAPESPPVTAVTRSAGQAAHLSDEAITRQLRALGAAVVRAARQFHAEGTCDYADERQFARHDHAVQPEAGSPAS
jgi:hypothetical protein